MFKPSLEWIQQLNFCGDNFYIQQQFLLYSEEIITYKNSENDLFSGVTHLKHQGIICDTEL